MNLFRKKSGDVAKKYVKIDQEKAIDFGRLKCYFDHKFRKGIYEVGRIISSVFAYRFFGFYFYFYFRSRVKAICDAKRRICAYV